MEFCDRLKIIRVEHEMSATDLASMLGKSESAVRMWETNRSKPDCDTLIKLAQYFNCSTDYLLGLDNSRNEQEVRAWYDKYDGLLSYLDSLDNKEREIIVSLFFSIIDSKRVMYSYKGAFTKYMDFLVVLDAVLENIGTEFSKVYHTLNGEMKFLDKGVFNDTPLSVIQREVLLRGQYLSCFSAISSNFESLITITNEFKYAIYRYTDEVGKESLAYKINELSKFCRDNAELLGGFLPLLANMQDAIAKTK